LTNLQNEISVIAVSRAFAIFREKAFYAALDLPMEENGL